MRPQWLLLATFALSVYGTGQVWLVQLSSYPLFRFVGPHEFHAYHLAWWRSIWGVVLAPAALVVIGALMMLWWRPPGVPAWSVWLGLALQIALVLGTLLALLVGWGPFIDFFFPFFDVLQNVPSFALLPLFIYFLGFSNTMIIFFSSITWRKEKEDLG